MSGRTPDQGRLTPALLAQVQDWFSSIVVAVMLST
jgi:hypothetical protein